MKNRGCVLVKWTFVVLMLGGISSVLLGAEQVTRVPKLVKVAAAAGAPAEEPPSNPLEEPFQPKHTYAGSQVPTNVVPIAVFVDGNHVCSAFRINKNWLITAAHCVDFFGTKDTQVSFQIHKGDNGIAEVQFRPVAQERPANAKIYFYSQGYKRDSKFGHTDDIALVRLDEKEKTSVVMARKNAAASLDIFIDQAAFVGEDNLKQLKTAKKQLSTASKVHKEFFTRPLNNYSFFVIPPEGVSYLAQHTGNIFEFRAYEGHAQNFHRDAPRVHSYRFQKADGAGSHELLWHFAGNEKRPDGEIIKASGSPVIINGFVVSNTSGPKGTGRHATPLYPPQFHDFLKRAMGKEYPQGLCTTPNLPGQSPKWEPKK